MATPMSPEAVAAFEHLQKLLKEYHLENRQSNSLAEADRSSQSRRRENDSRNSEGPTI
jgi:hypothetical protein